MNFKVNIFALFLIVVTALSSCKKDSNNNNQVPFVEVNFTINLDDPEFIKLRTVGNFEYINGGSKGLVIYRSSVSVFKAYDRNCTFDISQICSQLDVDATGFRLNDYDCCGSEFSLVNGTVLRGPAVVPLREYTTSFDGKIITVTN